MNSYLFKVRTKLGEEFEVLVVNAISASEAAGHVTHEVRRGDEAEAIVVTEVVSELKTFRVYRAR